MLLGLAVIATDCGATTDLVTPATGYAVEQRPVPVQVPGQVPGQVGGHLFGDGQVWADPDLDQAAWLIGWLAAEPERAAGRVVAARAEVRRVHAPQRVAGRQVARLRELGLVR